VQPKIISLFYIYREREEQQQQQINTIRAIAKQAKIQLKYPFLLLLDLLPKPREDSLVNHMLQIDLIENRDTVLS
jgi:hypothetical protein